MLSATDLAWLPAGVSQGSSAHRDGKGLSCARKRISETRKNFERNARRVKT